MRIALYYPWIYLQSGIERTIFELIKRSRHNWTIFTSHFDVNSTYPEFKNIKVIELKRVLVKRSYLKILKAAFTILFQKIDLKDFDALLIFSEGLGDLLTFHNHKKPIICYCWTPLKVIHDHFSKTEYLRNHKIKRPIFLLFSHLFKLIDKFAWRYYEYIFCCSNEVKKRIIKANLSSSERIEVLYPGADIEKTKPTWTYEPYFFHPARIKWWKNIELSIEAFKLFQRQCLQSNNFRLIIAGQIDKGSKGYYKKILRLSKGINNLQVVANPSAEQLNDFYNNCYAVLSTTLNEDWGITVIEAMAYGKPVIAVNQGGPKESIRDRETGFLVEPTAEGFSEVMGILAEDKNLVLKMGKEARAHSLKYDWDNFIKKIDEFFEKIEQSFKN